MGLLLNWFIDLGRSVRDGLGTTWTAVLLAFFSIMTIWLVQNWLRASINKTKIVFKWGQIIFSIIFLLLTIWFITLLSL